jgi:CelD/BcsL family acetyltransferase involved in cellulose biosynthesis
MTGLSTGIIADFAELQSAARAWEHLWRRSETATPFQSPAWLLPWWRHFQPGHLFAIAAWRSGELVGLAPFYQEDGPMGRRLLPVGISVSDHHDVLVDPADAQEVGAALVREALLRSDAWDRWEWEELLPDAAALTLSFAPQCRVEAAAQSACPVLQLTGDTLAGCVPVRKRRDVSQARNRARRRGPFHVEQTGEDNLERALDHLFRLHARRWETRGEAGVFADGRVRSFHRDAAAGLLAEGLLRLYVLRIAGCVAAVFYGFCHRARMYGYLTGLDPAFEYESPGVIIIAHAIEQALAEGVQEFHFLRGREAYKYRWGAVDRWNRRLSVRRNQADERAA